MAMGPQGSIAVLFYRIFAQNMGLKAFSGCFNVNSMLT